MCGEVVRRHALAAAHTTPPLGVSRDKAPFARHDHEANERGHLFFVQRATKTPATACRVSGLRLYY